MTSHIGDHFDYACIVCGHNLDYSDVSKEQRCDICGKVESSPISCPNGHFICDRCHSADALTFLKRLAQFSKSTSPREIVDTAFEHPSFMFHGPEHHSLVPAAILIALKNKGVSRPDGSPITTEMIHEGIQRGAKIPGGFCGAAGNCGACVGAGVAIALFVGSTPRRAEERRIAHRTTISALQRSEDGLIRCCKRATYYGISTAMEILKEKYNVDLGPVPEPESCRQSSRNRDCEEGACVYYALSVV